MLHVRLLCVVEGNGQRPLNPVPRGDAALDPQVTYRSPTPALTTSRKHGSLISTFSVFVWFYVDF